MRVSKTSPRPPTTFHTRRFVGDLTDNDIPGVGRLMSLLVHAHLLAARGVALRPVYRIGLGGLCSKIRLLCYAAIPLKYLFMPVSIVLFCSQCFCLCPHTVRMRVQSVNHMLVT